MPKYCRITFKNADENWIKWFKIFVKKPEALFEKNIFTSLYYIDPWVLDVRDHNQTPIYHWFYTINIK